MKTVEVPLTRGYVALIDEDDAPRVLAYKWAALLAKKKDGTLRRVYAVRTKKVGGRSTTIYMHRAVLDAPGGMQVDHIDRDGLNNTRTNLRLATGTQNHANEGLSSDNTSGVKGVYWHKQKGKWHVQCRVGKTSRSGGLHSSLEAAKQAYSDLSKALWGEFARMAEKE